MQPWRCKRRQNQATRSLLTASPHHPLKVRLLILLNKFFVTWFGPLYVCLGSKKLKLKPELGGDVMFLGRSGLLETKVCIPIWDWIGMEIDESWEKQCGVQIQQGGGVRGARVESVPGRGGQTFLAQTLTMLKQSKRRRYKANSSSFVHLF